MFLKPKRRNDVLNAIFIRVVFSLVTICAAATLLHLLFPVSAIGAAHFDALQLQNSDAAAAISAAGAGQASHITGFVWLAEALILGLIWGPLLLAMPDIVKHVRAPWGIILAAGMFIANAPPARAYYSQHDGLDVVGIPPDATAFEIPDNGDTLANQAQTPDIDFYNAHKVPGKVFFVQHVRLSPPGINLFGMGDYFVPAEHIIIVNRDPYHRDWTGASNTGTSAADQSIKCQTQEGLNVTAEVSITAHIEPADAATYLYNFGVMQPVLGTHSNNPADPNDPDNIFASVFYARPLTEVMDSIGRGLAEVAVCKSIGTRTLDQANHDYAAIADEANKAAQSYLKARGISVDYLGWAGTFSFDNDVQQAINQKYRAAAIQPWLGTLQAEAQILALEQKWNGALPASLTTLNSDAPGINGLLAAITGVRSQDVTK